MNIGFIGEGDREIHYTGITTGHVGTSTEGSSSDCTWIAQVARQETEAYVMDNNLPGFLEVEHESMSTCRTPEAVLAIIKSYFAREFPLHPYRAKSICVELGLDPASEDASGVIVAHFRQIVWDKMGEKVGLPAGTSSGQIIKAIDDGDKGLTWEGIASALGIQPTEPEHVDIGEVAGGNDSVGVTSVRTISSRIIKTFNLLGAELLAKRLELPTPDVYGLNGVHKVLDLVLGKNFEGGAE